MYYQSVDIRGNGWCKYIDGERCEVVEGALGKYRVMLLNTFYDNFWQLAMQSEQNPDSLTWDNRESFPGSGHPTSMRIDFSRSILARSISTARFIRCHRERDESFHLY